MLGENASDAIDWLVRTRDRWLLILDNADDKDLNLQRFIPSCSHGNIIITTRNRQLGFYERSLEVSRMPKDDAKALFVRRSRISDPQEATRDNLITRIVEVGILPYNVFHSVSYDENRSLTSSLSELYKPPLIF